MSATSARKPVRFKWFTGAAALLTLLASACSAPAGGGGTSGGPPAPVELLAPVIQCSTGGEPLVSASWTADSLADGYRLERDYALLASLTAEQLSFQDDSVDAYGHYTYVVEAHNAAGTSRSEPLQVSVPWVDCATVTGPVMAAGYRHSLAIGSDGTVWSWGSNGAGELGRGGDETLHQPGQVMGLAGITSVAAGDGVSFALDAAGNVWYWGHLGINVAAVGPQSWMVPVRLTELSGITAIAAGAQHTLALAADGSVYAWGRNQHGQLGTGNTFDAMQPIRVNAPADTVALAAGHDFSLALDAHGQVWAWGTNELYQLGSDSLDSSTEPLPVAGLEGITAIAAGLAHAVALREDGIVHAWGFGTDGQIGDSLQSHLPLQLNGPDSSATSVAAGGHTTLALLTDGTVLRWGSDGSVRDWDTNHLPQTVPGATNVQAVAAGRNFMLAATTDGQVLAWGRNDLNQLGTTADYVVQELSAIALPDEPELVAAGYAFTLALLQDGRLYSWGSNDDGGLGQGHDGQVERAVPGQVTGLPGDVLHVAAVGEHAIAVLEDGTAWTWGEGDSTLLGRPVVDDHHTPVQLPGLTGMVMAAAGTSHSLVMNAAGDVYGWGYNWAGQLGLGDQMFRATPVPLSLPGPADRIWAGADRSFALLQDGRLLAWGSGAAGALGDGGINDALVPVELDLASFGSGVRDLSAGELHTLAVLQNGVVLGWGSNPYAQLGISGPGSYNPVVLSSLPDGITAVSAGHQHSLALQPGVGVIAWGSNLTGVLPGAPGTVLVQPELLDGTDSAVGMLAASDRTLIVTGEDLLGAGNNGSGGLGQDHVFWSSSAIPVTGVGVIQPSRARGH